MIFIAMAEKISLMLVSAQVDAVKKRVLGW
jgi:hypothetical protein